MGFNWMRVIKDEARGVPSPIAFQREQQRQREEIRKRFEAERERAGQNQTREIDEDPHGLGL